MQVRAGRSLRRLALWGIMFIGAVWGTGMALAAYPEKPIRLIVGYAPGGASDVPFRALARAAGNILGQPVIVENKGGLGGAMSAQTLAKPDRTPLGIAVRKGTDPAIIDKLHDAFRQAMDDSDFKQVLAKYNMVPAYMDTATYTEYAFAKFQREKEIVETHGKRLP